MVGKSRHEEHPDLFLPNEENVTIHQMRNFLCRNYVRAMGDNNEIERKLFSELHARLVDAMKLYNRAIPR